MTAQEARQATQESKQIMEKISKAVFNGKSEINVTTLSTPIFEGLKSLGYTILNKGDFSDSFYIIKW